MNDRPPTRGAVAGSILIAAVLFCAGVGLGLGALVGAPIPLLIVGLGVGFAAGIALVRAHFGDL
ncbi:hypothetical protein [Conexibacter sp. CPCC 206217]|uniref:hypothetical protein n=1 Tax=Conexibacter sp. CPCC 206217 TaxID=3064574 RepID=UPI002715CF05|nr:hypothetical protein [Conexibacter sp. CPCC 206217]MDO8213091.1 hypothetical protein [Conexibacter sp. CPCC 206217]